MNAEGFRARLYSSLSYMCYLNYANSPSYQSTEQLISLMGCFELVPLLKKTF